MEILTPVDPKALQPWQFFMEIGAKRGQHSADHRIVISAYSQNV